VLLFSNCFAGDWTAEQAANLQNAAATSLIEALNNYSSLNLTLHLSSPLFVFPLDPCDLGVPIL
jgi:hypothetical protein